MKKLFLRSIYLITALSLLLSSPLSSAAALAASTTGKTTITSTAVTAPSSGNITSLSQLADDSLHRLVTDTEKAYWNAKASTAIATTTINGLMSALDKLDLNALKSELIAARGSYANLNSRLNSIASGSTGSGTGSTTVTGPGTGMVDVTASPYNADKTGVTDAYSAFQNAMNYASTNRLPLYIPPGKYLINQSLTIPSKLTMVGANGYFTVGDDMSNAETLIIAGVSPLFQGGTASAPLVTKLEMRNIAITSKNGGGVVFNFYDLRNSYINRCIFRNFDTVINGQITWLTRIMDNTFLNIRSSAITNRLMAAGYDQSGDSYIVRNYFNGSTSYTNTKMLDMNYPNMMVIDQNFFDFTYNAINISSGKSVTISNNQFDYSPVAVNLIHGANTTIIGNRFSNSRMANATRWTYPTTTMVNNKWIGIKLGSQSGDVSIVGNKGYLVDTLLEMNGAGYVNISSLNNNTYDSLDQVWNFAPLPDSGFIFKGMPDGTGISIGELNPVSYPRTGPPTTGYFTKGTIIYNSNPAAGLPIGWVCTASGTPGTWRSFGTIN